EFWFEGAAGARVHGFLVKPPQFEAGKKYPVVFIIHGGPQGMFSRDFHERWNAQMFAAPGYVAVLIDPRGSTGYGQDFTDAINGEWGGNCYEDLIRGFDYVLDTYDYCDRERTCAIGASFGGFMVNWMATQTNRFKCFVSHDGIFNTEMMNWATDELWFTEWEFNGLPSEARESYLQYSPHRLVHQIETPMLVIQGELDYRCTTGEGLGLFTALRRHGVDARLLYFPDEGHWVLKPKNRKVWYKTVLDWIEKYI
ncbi:MAG: S9 family peptidase, partial [Candidatus Eisenbacteria bacterium]|nr:S9 family peptidase [Candidatus Eisenbacteria bacterium]